MGGSLTMGEVEMWYSVLVLILGAGDFMVYTPGVDVAASSIAGGKYAAASGVDGSTGTRWASADRPALPQWYEVRLDGAKTVDTVLVDIAVDDLYSDWREVELSFSEGEALRRTLEAGTKRLEFRFEPRQTEWVRLTILSLHETRHYVGLYEVIIARDPKGLLGKSLCTAGPKKPEDIEVRGRTDHPCVNITAADVEHALARIDRHAWAKRKRDEIVEAADRWLRESDAFWLGFLPKPGACYAYGFTGDPITGESLGGTWAGARCSWEHPGKVQNAQGRWLPDDEYPDDGQGYTAPDGRIHYLVGIFNAWVTEQWTLNALPALSKAYLLTKDERYAQRGILLLDALASIYAESISGSWDYPSDPPSGRLARPWYQVARTLVKYVDYYDFLYHSPAMDEPSLRPGMARRENIERHMLLDGAYYCYKHSFDGGLHNGHADYLRGALAVGCVLDIPEYIRNAVDSPFSIHAMLANNIDRDGRYYETSPGYAIHARNLYLTFADPLRNLRSAEYPEGLNLYDDPKMQSCLFLPDTQIELAGRRPNFGDCGPDYTYKPFPIRTSSSTDYDYLERLYAATSDPEKKREYGNALAYLAEGDIEQLRAAQNDDWILWHAEELGAAESALSPEVQVRATGSWVAGMKGMALLRAGKQAALLRFGPSLNHGDLDDLALLYYANGYELSYDIGYGLGSTHAQVGWASSTVSHCLVTVDETNQLQADGSGGSLIFFGALPGVQVVEAASEASYAQANVTEYRRTVALMADGRYLVDVFRVAGGHQHDYGFGSIGPDLTPFGVEGLEGLEGSLAAGVAWGEKIGRDGDIVGYPNKPYWNPPPRNGYGFFHHVRRAARPSGTWGGTWAISGPVPTQFRMHVVGDADEAIFASAPGLYPSMPLSSYVLARRKAEDTKILESTFLAVYEPFATPELQQAFGYRDLAACMTGSSGVANTIDSLGVVLLRGTAAGEAMSFLLHLRADMPALLVLYCVKAPSYGVLQAEWDGRPVGAPVNLYNDTTAGPVPFEIGEVDASAGEHRFTVRAAEGTSFFLGVGGVSFGPVAPAGEPAAIVRAVRRLGKTAIEIERVDGVTDVILCGASDVESALGHIRFDGDFALLTGEGKRPLDVETLGCARLEADEKVLDSGPAAFEATISAVNLEDQSVELDKDVPDGLAQLVAVFSHPRYSRTTAYHIRKGGENRLWLQASSLSLGKGRVHSVRGQNTIASDIGHEYAKTVSRAFSTRFFDGKRLVGEHGGATRVLATIPGDPMLIEVEDAGVFDVGETFEYVDLCAGDTVRVALPRNSGLGRATGK